MKTYQPNFTDSRIIARIERALTFVELYAKVGKIEAISSTQLYKYLGNTSRQPGKWLKENLLIVADPHYSMDHGVCIKYKRNVQGYKKLKKIINYEFKVSDEIIDQFQTGNFEYQTKSNRDYTAAQFIPKRIRNQLAANAGMRYHYDIQAAAPRMLLQRAQQLNPKLECPTLAYYINNRSQVREQLAKECEISANNIKLVVNAILQGGTISSWSKNKIFAQLNYNYDSIKKLNNNTTICSLKSDIKSLWDSLRGNFPVVYISDKNGKQIRKRISSKQKSQFYRELEEEVGSVIKKLLKRNKFLWIHDGWACDCMIDPNLIVSEVRRQTGIVIELEWTIYEE